MVVLVPQSDYGKAPPPQTPYSIVTNVPGWSNSQKLRDGDMSVMAGVTHIYPRFGPTHFVAQLAQEISKRTGGEEGKGAFVYLNPEMMSYTIRHATNPHRGEHVLRSEDLSFKCVDIAGHRLYLVLFPMSGMFGVNESWGNPGVGLSIRGAEELLKNIDDLKVVPMDDINKPPEPTWTPESDAHRELRTRVAELVNRAPKDPQGSKCTENDVFLYPTGMAAVYESANVALKYRPGTRVILGVVFHNTHHHLLEESGHGFKHFGKVDEASLDEFESWLDAQTSEGRPVSYVFVEFPGNPTLDTPDLARLKRLSEKHSFVLVADDTVSSFANVDLLSSCDVLLTSLTKSFSGLANVMGGSIVLNPRSPHYAALQALFTSTHRNELFVADAKVLLSNSQGFLDRAVILNRNANAVATYLSDRMASEPGSVLSKVYYPTLQPGRRFYDAFKRASSTEIPEPGYGCLFTLEFEDVNAARAFHDNCGFYTSPHLGAHVTIQLAYNMVVWGRKKEDREAFRDLDVKEESVRISVGLESAEDIVDTMKYALDQATLAKKNGYP